MSTPYDLRFSIYSQAQGRLEAKYYAEMTVWERKRENGESTPEPIFPSHEQILEEAEKIYEFVQNKG